jgi:predicted nucleic acid-binding protein
VELADTSVWSVSRRPGNEDLRAWVSRTTLVGDIATCDMVRLEVLYSTRNPGEFATVREGLDQLPDCPIDKPQWRRALSVYEQLAAKGGAHQRSVGYADLLIAAAAESAGIPLLHYDSDFERIAEITGQPARWIVPRGSL